MNFHFVIVFYLFYFKYLIIITYEFSILNSFGFRYDWPMLMTTISIGYLGWIGLFHQLLTNNLVLKIIYSKAYILLVVLVNHTNIQYHNHLKNKLSQLSNNV